MLTLFFTSTSFVTPPNAFVGYCKKHGHLLGDVRIGSKHSFLSVVVNIYIYAVCEPQRLRRILVHRLLISGGATPGPQKTARVQCLVIAAKRRAYNLSECSGRYTVGNVLDAINRQSF